MGSRSCLEYLETSGDPRRCIDEYSSHNQTDGGEAQKDESCYLRGTDGMGTVETVPQTGFTTAEISGHSIITQERALDALREILTVDCVLSSYIKRLDEGLQKKALDWALWDLERARMRLKELITGEVNTLAK